MWIEETVYKKCLNIRDIYLNETAQLFVSMWYELILYIFKYKTKSLRNINIVYSIVINVDHCC